MDPGNTNMVVARIWYRSIGAYSTDFIQLFLYNRTTSFLMAKERCRTLPEISDGPVQGKRLFLLRITVSLEGKRSGTLKIYLIQFFRDVKISQCSDLLDCSSKLHKTAKYTIRADISVPLSIAP